MAQLFSACEVLAGSWALQRFGLSTPEACVRSGLAIGKIPIAITSNGRQFLLLRGGNSPANLKLVHLNRIGDRVEPLRHRIASSFKGLLGIYDDASASERGEIWKALREESWYSSRELIVCKLTIVSLLKFSFWQLLLPFSFVRFSFDEVMA